MVIILARTGDIRSRLTRRNPAERLRLNAMPPNIAPYPARVQESVSAAACHFFGSQPAGIGRKRWLPFVCAPCLFPRPALITLKQARLELEMRLLLFAQQLGTKYQSLLAGGLYLEYS